MADVLQVPPGLDQRQIEALRRLHVVANETVAAFAGTQTATAAAMIASGARRKLLDGFNDVEAARTR